MTKKRRTKLIYRWALVTGCLFTLVWTIWYLVTGSVPVNSLASASIPRWWDVMMAPVCSTTIIFIFSSTDEYPTECWDFCLIGLGSGLVFGVAAGVVILGMVTGLIAGALLGLAISSAIGLLWGLIALIRLIVISSIGARKQCMGWLMAKDA